MTESRSRRAYNEPIVRKWSDMGIAGIAPKKMAFEKKGVPGVKFHPEISYKMLGIYIIYITPTYKYEL